MSKKNDIRVTPAKETRTWIREKDLELICEAWENYEGQVELFESAVGAFICGRFAGYDALRVLHSWRTLRKYEDILGISFKHELEQRTSDSRRVNGIRYAEKFQQFWKALGAGVAQQPDAKSLATS